MGNRKFQVVDLYSGCGGFSLGAELAGFNSIAAVDIDATLQSSFKLNFPHANVIQADLAKTLLSDWQRYIEVGQVDGVIGGPPCQAFSRLGKGDNEDPRRNLLLHFFRHVNELLPKFFVMENVEGLLDEKNLFLLKNALSSLDKRYKTLAPIVVDASKLGAPTIRKRVFVIGYDPKYMSDIDAQDFLLDSAKMTNVQDAISDLSSPIKTLDKDNSYAWSEYKLNQGLSEYAKLMRMPPQAGLGSLEALEKLREGFFSGNFATTHTSAVQRRYAELEAGKTDPVSRAKKLRWDGHCPTLRAGTGKDKGSHQAVRPIHPDEARVITVREAARLQGFPDWFIFHNTIWHSFRMIGNSVSPIVSAALMKVIKAKLDQKQQKQAV